MSYTHITTFERGRIQELLNLGLSHNRIAKKLGHHRSTIDREIERNAADGVYIGEISHERYLDRRLDCHCKGEYTAELVH